MLQTMAAVAAAKGITMPDMEVHASAEMRDVPGQPADTVIRSVITYRGELSPREWTILFNSARRCEVHKLLRGRIEFEEQMEPAP
jgi:uncharacterized OsmC-like protein